MARTGKGDLVDYGKVVNDKKETQKITVPDFSDLADNKTMNERQEIAKPIQEKKRDNTNKTIQKNKHEQKRELVPKNNTEQFLEQFSNNATKEDTHTRQTWLIKNETIKRLDKLSKGKRKGFKTELVNQALEMFLHQIEDK
ncbi:hypothetical protein ACQKIW_31010 [Bacillus thuringiensis]|uniref:hypothetical protein n=1 Tax=Bacillus thuringiensis TaxID=1428 RepID=UPI003D0896BD